jgi:hypothetical protein
MSGEDEIKEISAKLDIILILLGVFLAIQIGPDAPLKEKAKLLKDAGLDNKSIAKILNTTPESISSLLYYGKKPVVAFKKKKITRKGDSRG